MIFATTNEDIMDMKNQESKSEVCNSIKQINISTQVTSQVDYNVDHIYTASLCMWNIS